MFIRPPKKIFFFFDELFANGGRRLNWLKRLPRVKRRLKMAHVRLFDPVRSCSADGARACVKLTNWIRLTNTRMRSPDAWARADTVRCGSALLLSWPERARSEIKSTVRPTRYRRISFSLLLSRPSKRLMYHCETDQECTPMRSSARLAVGIDNRRRVSRFLARRRFKRIQRNGNGVPRTIVISVFTLTSVTDRTWPGDFRQLRS